LLVQPLFILLHLTRIHVLFFKFVDSVHVSLKVSTLFLLAELAALDAVVCFLFLGFPPFHVQLEHKLTPVVVRFTEVEVALHQLRKSFADIQTQAI